MFVASRFALRSHVVDSGRSVIAKRWQWSLEDINTLTSVVTQQKKQKAPRGFQEDKNLQLTTKEVQPTAIQSKQYKRKGKAGTVSVSKLLSIFSDTAIDNTSSPDLLPQGKSKHTGDIKKKHTTGDEKGGVAITSLVSPDLATNQTTMSEIQFCFNGVTIQKESKAETELAKQTTQKLFVAYHITQNYRTITAIIEEMKRSDVLTFDQYAVALLRAFKLSGSLEEFQTAYFTLRAQGYFPDAQMYNMVIRIMSVKEDLTCWGAYNELLLAGFSPSDQALLDLLVHCCKYRSVSHVTEIYARIKQRRVVVPKPRKLQLLEFFIAHNLTTDSYSLLSEFKSDTATYTRYAHKVQESRQKQMAANK
uniref:Uncharacterized protein n=1 Tax=Vannella robusta TaxID=1487602 RepID=A0A7S4IC25_9EUKA